MRSVRWDEANACALCFGCHQYFHENHDEFKEFMRHKLGERAFDMLEGRARVPQKFVDKEAIKIWLKAEIKKLE